MASIRKRGQKWQARIIRRGHLPVAKTFISRSDATKWARAVEREIDQGSYTNRTKAERQILGELLKRYREEVSPRKRGGALEAVRLKRMENRSWAKLSLAALSASVIAAYRDDRLKLVAPATINRELNILSAVLNHARREWGIPVSNCVAEIRRPPSGPGRNRILEPEEETCLMTALDDPGRDAQGRLASGTRNHWIKPVVKLALETAMRRGELLSLRWEQVDLNRQTAYLPMTKNGEPRTVPLSRAAVSLLAELPRSIGGRVFPITPMALRKAFERACVRAGIANLHFHDLRHTATTRLAAKVPNLIELAAITGHKDVRMLARYYHPKAEELAKKIG